LPISQVRAAFGEDLQDNSEQHKMNEHFGEVNVSVQMFKNVPMQVKLTDGNEEKRFGLPERFAKAVAELQSF
ncbi:virulence factor, partial [Escherichia coli]|nr:virulence factor [Escherichia coli]